MYVRPEGNGVNLVGVDGQEWELCKVLFADDTVLVAYPEDNYRSWQRSLAGYVREERRK